MKIYNQRVARSISVSTAGLVAVIFYLLLTLVLNLVQNILNPTGEEFNQIYAMIQLGIISAYWIILNFFYFSRPGKSRASTVIIYTLYTLLPIILFAIGSVVVIEFYPTTEFILSWNLMTWLIGPTLFWFLPYSYIYYSFGFSIPITWFMGIILAYILVIFLMGIILGLIARSYSAEKATKRRMQSSQVPPVHPAVTFDEMASETGNGSNYVKPNLNVDDDEITLDKFERDETDFINEEIDRINNDFTYRVEDDPLFPEDTK